MPRILIVGAGISGLTLVRAMRLMPSANAWDIDLVERTERFTPVGCGIVLHPNGCSALSCLGLAAPIARRGAHIRHMEIRRGGEAMVLDLEEIWAGAGHPTLGIARPALHQVLADAALAECGDRVSLRLGCRLVSLDWGGPRPVATFSDGSSAAYELVVGADGAHSSVRQIISPEIAASPTGAVYIRFMAENSIDLPEDRWLVFEETDHVRGFIPIGAGRLHCFVQLKAAAPPDPRQAAEILDAVATLHSDFAACRQRASPVHVNAAYFVAPLNWGRENCVLIGDAAHAVAPSLSEGGALAMEDSLALAEALEIYPSIKEALAGFAAVREKAVLWAQRMSRAQVNARPRSPAAGPIDPAAAAKHMRCMYEPLRRGAARDRDGAASWWSELAPQRERNGHERKEQSGPAGPGFRGDVARQDERQEARRDRSQGVENREERQRDQVDAALGRAVLDQVGGQIAGTLAGQDGRLAC